MSGIISGINYSGAVLVEQFDHQHRRRHKREHAYSGSTSSSVSTASTGNPLLDLKIDHVDQTADVAKEAQQPQVSQAIAAFVDERWPVPNASRSR